MDISASSWKCLRIGVSKYSFVDSLTMRGAAMALAGTDPLTRGGPSHRQHMLWGETLRYSPEVQSSNMTVCETQAEVFLSQWKARNSNGETTAVFHFLGRVQAPQFMVRHILPEKPPAQARKHYIPEAILSDRVDGVSSPTSTQSSPRTYSLRDVKLNQDCCPHLMTSDTRGRGGCAGKRLRIQGQPRVLSPLLILSVLV